MMDRVVYVHGFRVSYVKRCLLRTDRFELRLNVTIFKHIFST